MRKLLIILLFMVLSVEAHADTIARRYDPDFDILYDLQQRRTPTRNRQWLMLSNSLALSPMPAVGFGVYGWAAGDKAAVYNGAELGGSWLLTTGVTMAIKYIVNRPRPYVTYSSELVCLQPPPDPSFPSGHTSLCFATATTLSLMYPKWYVVVPAYLWAVGVGYSRLYIGAHYPTDVVAGAMLGISTAVAAHWIRSRIMQQHPDIAPIGNAVVLPLTLVF